MVTITSAGSPHLADTCSDCKENPCICAEHGIGNATNAATQIITRFDHGIVPISRSILS
jgi:hypothetical protein